MKNKFGLMQKEMTEGKRLNPYLTVMEASLKDKELYELLTMEDAIRVGKIRE